MPRVFLRNSGGVFAQAFTTQATVRGLDPVLPSSDADHTLPSDISALVLCDLLPALMLRPTPQDAVARLPDEAQMARIESLIDAAIAADVPRIVALSTPQVQLRAVPAEVIAAATRLENALARAGMDRVVLLRTAEVMDPMDPETQAMVRDLIRDGQAGVKSGDPVQSITLNDLAMAAAAAADVKGATGKRLDIVAKQAVSRRSFAQEAERLAQILTNPDQTEVLARPSYGAEVALMDAAPAAATLHVAPNETPWTALAKTVQELVRQSCEAGELPPKVPPMPFVHEALETGALPLAGKHVVLTGVTHSVGREVAKMLIRLGADVTGVARGREAGEALAARIAEDRGAWERVRARHARLAAETGRAKGPVTGDVGQLRLEQADLADLDAVKELASRLLDTLPRIDGLVHAGILTAPDRRETAQGNETILAGNLLTPLALTRLLAVPLLAAGADGGARVVNMVTDGHADEPIHLDDLQSRWSYAPTAVLARASSGLIMMTSALASAMDGTGVSAVVVNAGNVAGGTAEDISQTIGAAPTTKQRLEAQQKARRAAQAGQAPAVSPADAAAHLVDALVSPDFADHNGAYVTGGAVADPADHVTDTAQIDALWLACADLSGLAP